MGAGGRHRVIQGALVGIPLVGFAVAGWTRRWVVDDGFIYLRVVQQVRAGNGPVFNAGERVEAYTSPLWTGILVVADLVTPVRLEWLAVLLGIGLSVAGLGLAMAGARRLAARADGSDGADGWWVPFGALVPVALVPFWIFQTSGLETGLVFAWLGACCFALARWAASEGTLAWWGAVVVGLGWLVRPELAVFSAAFVVAVLATSWSADSWVGRARLVGAAVALPAVYQVFRMGYFGALVANSAVAKNASSTNWSRGWDYVVDFAGAYWIVVPAVVLVVGGYVPLVRSLVARRAHRAVAVLGAFVGGAFLHWIYIAAVGGDWIHARLLLPGVFALVAPVAVVAWSRRHLVGVAIVPWVVVLAFVARPPHLDPDYPTTEPFTLANAPSAAGKVTVDDYRWGAGSGRTAWYDGPGYYHSPAFAFGVEKVDIDVHDGVRLPMLSVGAVGAVSFAFGPELHILDTNGLADAFTARLATRPSRVLFPRKPGHEKPLPEIWLAARLLADDAVPDAEDIPPRANPLIEPTTGDEFVEQVAWARAALRCPDVAELFDAVREPLGPGRFLRNLVGSPSRTRLAIPPEPEAAYARFCGDGIPDEVLAVRGG